MYERNIVILHIVNTTNFMKKTSIMCLVNKINTTFMLRFNSVPFVKPIKRIVKTKVLNSFNKHKKMNKCKNKCNFTTFVNVEHICV